MIIGIIDSGKGGLAVAKRIKKEGDQFILLLDQGFFPYGTKSKEFLLKRSFYLAHILISMQVDLIILACNTLSIYALPFLKGCIKIPVLGVFDYFKPFLTKEYTLLGSKATITYVQNKYPVNVYDGTDFIKAIEQGNDITPFIEELKKMKSKAVVLGCTHFLAIDEKAYPLPAINQISFLLEDIKKARNSSSH